MAGDHPVEFGSEEFEECSVRVTEIAAAEVRLQSESTTQPLQVIMIADQWPDFDKEPLHSGARVIRAAEIECRSDLPGSGNGFLRRQIPDQSASLKRNDAPLQRVLLAVDHKGREHDLSFEDANALRFRWGGRFRVEQQGPQQKGADQQTSREGHERCEDDPRGESE